MFDDLQRIFRQSLAAFRSEMGKREPEDEVADLLQAMRREWVAARAQLPELAQLAERTQAELARERQLLEQTERRGKAAERIGDAETVRVATEFAARHRERIVVLEQKAGAVEAEQKLRAREVEEMKRKYHEADTNRFRLVAELRRARGRTRMQAVSEGTEGSFADWARMEEKIEDTRAYADALEELDPSPSPSDPTPGAAPDLEERLRELKRRLGKE